MKCIGRPERATATDADLAPSEQRRKNNRALKQAMMQDSSSEGHVSYELPEMHHPSGYHRH